MEKNEVLESLVGQEVELTCLDREETDFYGELLEVSNLGATLKYSDHGREFIEFIPMTNINTLNHKVLGK